MRKCGINHKAEGEGYQHGQGSFCCWLLWEGMGEAGKAGLGLADRNNFKGSGAQGLSLVV